MNANNKSEKVGAIKHARPYRLLSNELRTGIDILVVAPGRLLDLMGQGYVKLGRVKRFVLDEAAHIQGNTCYRRYTLFAGHLKMTENKRYDINMITKGLIKSGRC